MKNIEMSVTDTILTIRVDLSRNYGESGSGKSIVIASTEGNRRIPGADDLRIGLNVYQPKEG